MIRILTASICMLTPVLLCGQSSFTLEECLKIGLEENIGLRMQKFEVERAANETALATLSILPSLNAYTGGSFSWGRSVDMQELVIVNNKMTGSANASISASAVLFNGFSGCHTIRRRRLGEKVAEAEAEKVRREISIGIVQAFLKLLLSQEMLDNARTSLDNITVQTQKCESAVRAGGQPRSALYAMEARKAAEHMETVSAEGDVAAAKMALMLLLDRPFDESFEISSPPDEGVPPLPSFPTVDEMRLIAESLPEYRGSLNEIYASEEDLAISKSGFYPSLAISAGFGTYYSSASQDKFKTQFANNHNPTVELGLTIPLFDSGAALYKKRNAEMTVRQKKLERDRIFNELYAEIREQYTQLMVSRQKCLAAEAELLSSKAALKVEESRFDSGEGDVTDYIVALNNASLALGRYTQAKYSYIFQLKIIGLYVKK